MYVPPYFASYPDIYRHFQLDGSLWSPPTYVCVFGYLPPVSLDKTNVLGNTHKQCLR